MNYVKGLGYILSIAIVFFGAQSFVSEKTSETKVLTPDVISWYGPDELDQLKSTKPIIVDIYTEWCGPCKAMDKNTFGNPDMIKYLNENFAMVKLNAEQKESIDFNGKTYKHVPRSKRGVNELAIELLKGKMAYPSLVILDTNFETIKVMKGYKDPASLKGALEALNL